MPAKEKCLPPNSLANQSLFPPDEANLIFRFLAVSSKSADAIGSETCAYFIYSLAAGLSFLLAHSSCAFGGRRQHLAIISDPKCSAFRDVRWSIAGHEAATFAPQTPS